MKPLLLTALVLLTSTFACRPHETGSSNQPAVYGSFFIRYMEDGRQLKATASFFEGDTLATARPKAWEGGVAFLGSVMDARDLAGSEFRYTAERQLDFRSDYTFRFTDGAGKQREVKAAINPMAEMKFKAPASKQTGLIFTHAGIPLQAGESVVILLMDAQNQTYSLTLNGPQRSTEIILDPAAAAALPVGTLQWYAVRKQKYEGKEGRFDYSVETEYYTIQTAVEILR